MRFSGTILAWVLAAGMAAVLGCNGDDETNGGGTGATPGSGGSSGTGASSGTGGDIGSGGTGGATTSCVEVDIEGEPNIDGPLRISPDSGSSDDFVTVTIGVDGDTQEVSVYLRNESSGFIGGSGFSTTPGNETVEVDVLIGTIADPGPHEVDLELRSGSATDYIVYEPGDGETYVRIKVEDGVPGPETATPCFSLSCTVE